MHYGKIPESLARHCRLSTWYDCVIVLAVTHGTLWLANYTRVHVLECVKFVSFHHCDRDKGLTAFVRWSMNCTRANSKTFLTFIHSGFWSQHSLFPLFNSHSDLAPGLRISGAIPLLRFMPFWCGQDQHYFLNHLFCPPTSTDWCFNGECVFCEVDLNFYKIITYADFALPCIKIQSLRKGRLFYTAR